VDGSSDGLGVFFALQGSRATRISRDRRRSGGFVSSRDGANEGHCVPSGSADCGRHESNYERVWVRGREVRCDARHLGVYVQVRRRPRIGRGV
jgi:hypothetical protein